ncbi:hypothetical protein MAM1_0284d09231 [Mucor ambiguus]|uniref:Lebercilin domain-containing protein n=1 Tax=Mucor ambiguus TaxID=91626 RepID=A0A0C9MQH1_9FUNG|nr:hypothetical protein MAM1_0284d09231 [Mucor ambiguus]
MLSVQHSTNKSRIPIPITSQQRHNNKKMNKAAVTPAKLDQKKNNNKSSLFSTTCSRMAQEARNYNKPYIKSEHSHKRLPFPSSLTTRNNNNNNSKMNTNMRKSPITQLKEDLETWRQKKLDAELLVQEQSNAITKLKKQLALQTEIQQERQRNALLQSKLKAITAEIESLSVDVVDSLDVRTTLDQDAESYTDTIKELQSQLESKEDDFKRKLGQYQRELQRKEQCIQRQQATHKQLQKDHAAHIARLNTAHMDRVQALQAQHKKEAATFRTPSKPYTPSIDISTAIEQALNEFEQEQHSHAPSPPPITTYTPLVYHPVALTAPVKTNQQCASSCT